MYTILLGIDWEVATGYFSWLLISVIVIYLTYCVLIKLRNLINDLNRKEKVQITGFITEIVDDTFPVFNPHYCLDGSGSLIFYDEKGQPIVGHNYWMTVESVESKDIAHLINLTKELFDAVAVNFNAGARLIKINCDKLMYNGKLDGEEIVSL